MTIRRALATAAVAVGLVACSGPASAGLTEEQTAFLDNAHGIDSRLTGDRQQALKLGATICAALARGESAEQVAADTRRFAQGESVISKEQAAALVTDAKRKLCR